jgi:NTP pyrophosphatase (non-canonical NTP hydrolase)
MNNAPINNRVFSEINWARCISEKGFNDPSPDPVYLALCICEEAGEVAGAVKKLKRGFNKREQAKAKRAFIKECGPENAPLEDEIDLDQLKYWWEKKVRAKIGKEIADLFTYMDLFATRQNIDIPVVVVNKFNEVNQEMECTEFNIPIESVQQK